MSAPDSNPEKRIALFQRKEVRRLIHNNEWWLVIADVVAVLTDSANPQGYFKDMRKRDPQLAEALKGGANCPLGLEFDTASGRQMLQCWNTEGIFRSSDPYPAPRPSRSNAGSLASAKISGFDPAKVSSRWTEPDKFVALISEQSIARLKRGSAFLPPKSDSKLQ
jgi:hypothetical protein